MDDHGDDWGYLGGGEIRLSLETSCPLLERRSTGHWEGKAFWVVLFGDIKQILRLSRFW